MVGLTYRDQLDPTVAAEFDSTIPRIIQSALGQVQLSTLTDYVPWTDIPFNINQFGPIGGGNDWTPTAANINCNKYMVLGKTMWMQLWVNAATLPAVRSFLWWGIPDGYRARNQTASVGVCFWREQTGGVGGTANPLYGTGEVTVSFDSGGTNPFRLTVNRNDEQETVFVTGFNVGVTNFFDLRAQACFELA
jgi:hypothetical protein